MSLSCSLTLSLVRLPNAELTELRDADATTANFILIISEVNLISGVSSPRGVYSLGVIGVFCDKLCDSVNSRESAP